MCKRLFLTALMSVSMIGCSALHTEGWKNIEGDTGLGLNLGGNQVSEADSIAMFSQTLHPILTQNCGSCHGASQMPLHSTQDPTTAHNTISQAQLVNFSNIESSRLVAKIRNGHQNIPQSVGDAVAGGIQAWLDLLIQANPGGNGTLPVQPPEVIPLGPTFKSINANILQPRCVGCHNPTGERQQEDYSSYQTAIATGGIAPGNPADSEMLKECISGSMPEGSDPLSDEELAALEQWIADGALNN